MSFQDLPDWLSGLIETNGWPEFTLVLIILAAILIAVLLHGVLSAAIQRALRGNSSAAANLLGRTRGLTRLAFVLLGVAIVLPAARFDPAVAETIRRMLAVGLFVAIGWAVLIVIDAWSTATAARYRIDVEDNLLARRMHTQVRILRRGASFLTIIVTLAAVLMSFPSFRTYGISLFASAGVASIVIGFAARPVLGNLIAGVQIALTQPIRIDDVVIVEGEWGWIEEINSTYVVLRLWDWRRLVVPLTYFIETPFQNWTRETAAIIGTVFWQVDYTMPVAEMRAKLEELAGQSPLWDGRVVNLQVTETGPATMTIRALISAKDSPTAWDLRCEIREKMITWLQQTHPQALPRLRAELAPSPHGNEAAGPTVFAAPDPSAGAA